MTLTHRPCGACAELVDAEEGCAHWKGGVTSTLATTDTRTAEELVAGALREATDGRAPVSRLLALHRAPKQREILERCLTAEDRSVTTEGIHALRTTLEKMVKQGYLEKTGQRAGRALGLRYRITDLGALMLAEWKRVYLSALPLPRE